MKISLIGYMGSGKSATAKQLSSLLELPYIDLDHAISASEKLEIPQIFHNKGEIYFRKKENQILSEILADNSSFILATGGGTPCYFNNIDVLNQHSITVYLSHNPLDLAARLSKDKTQRPLISHIPEEDLPEFIAKHLFERNQFYQKAQIIINAANKTPQQIADEIYSQIKAKNHQNPT